MDWIEVLRAECQRTSQRQAAEAIGYSPAVVSQVLKGAYKGDLSAVETAVRGAFMGRNVACPVLGELPANRCLAYQRQPFAATNPQRVKLYRACRAGCPHSQLKGGES